MNRILRSCQPLLLLAVVCLSGRTPLLAQTVSPMPAPTIITTAPYPITTAGYYQLGANLTYNGTGATNDAIITISANNVTLDFGGHYISGPTSNAATALIGVYANEKANLIIQNGTVAHCAFAIYLNGNASTTTNNRNSRVQNMLISTCTVGGIFGVDPINTVVSGCTIDTIGGSTLSGQNATGVFFEGSNQGNQFNNNTVTSVTCSSSGAAAGGLVANSSATMTGNVISGVSNTVTATSAYGLYDPIFALGNQVSNCNIGIYNAGKYKDNLTSGCTTPFSGGTAVGTNN